MWEIIKVDDRHTEQKKIQFTIFNYNINEKLIKSNKNNYNIFLEIGPGTRMKAITTFLSRIYTIRQVSRPPAYTPLQLIKKSVRIHFTNFSPIFLQVLSQRSSLCFPSAIVHFVWKNKIMGFGNGLEHHIVNPAPNQKKNLQLNVKQVGDQTP